MSTFVASFSKIKFSNNAKFKQINLHISSIQSYSVLSTIAQVLRKNEIEKFGILIFMSNVSETLESYQSVQLCPYSVNDLEFYE